MKQYIILLSGMFAIAIVTTYLNSHPVTYFETNSLETVLWSWNFYFFGAFSVIAVNWAWKKRLQRIRLKKAIEQIGRKKAIS